MTKGDLYAQLALDLLRMKPMCLECGKMRDVSEAKCPICGQE